MVAKTFALQTAASLPAHAGGMALGGYLGSKFIEPHTETLSKKLGWLGKKLELSKPGSGKALGVAGGMMAVGGLADLASLKLGLHKKEKAK